MQSSVSPDPVAGDLQCMWVSKCEEYVDSPPVSSNLDAIFESREVFIGLRTSHCRCPEGWAVMRSDSGCCPSDRIAQSESSESAVHSGAPRFLQSVSTEFGKFTCNPVCLDTAIAPPACGPAGVVHGTNEDATHAVFEAAYEVRMRVCA